ncbi:hypothetical protein [Erysipelothrix tonsillarum]|uniref:hypothetical protein n=1 Tax=Erysipelothrix tonsillarum TaxID=38402 RepID=UPI0039C80187
MLRYIGYRLEHETVGHVTSITSTQPSTGLWVQTSSENPVQELLPGLRPVLKINTVSNLLYYDYIENLSIEDQVESLKSSQEILSTALEEIILGGM